MKLTDYSDPASLAVVIVTFVLFFIALFAKGVTHDLFLEAGVLLVSIKLIIMAYKNARVAQSIHQKLADIHTRLGCGSEDREQGTDRT